MIQCEISILRKGDPACYPELEGKEKHAVMLQRVVVLEGGTEGGNAGVALLAELPDGSWVMMQTTARIFCAAAAAVRGACASWGENPG